MENKRENLVTYIFVVILVIIIAIIIYTIYLSNSNLSNNKSETTDKNIEQEDKKNEDNESNKPNNNPNNNINIPPVKEPVAPKTPTEEELTAFTTTIYDKDPNRVHNITLAISKLNNHIIKKGEVFSFNNTIGAMGENMGYKKALGFDSKGKKIKISGGGLCQISSTIYNTALNSKFEIIERHPHSKRVYYVPKDKDATIVYGSLDLKFKNNTEFDIKVLGSNDDKSVTIKLMKIVT